MEGVRGIVPVYLVDPARSYVYSRAGVFDSEIAVAGRREDGSLAFHEGVTQWGRNRT